MLFLVGLFVMVGFPLKALDHSDDPSSRVGIWAFAIAGVLVGGFLILRVAWCGVRVLETGVRVMNPFRTRSVAWRDVVGFSLRSWGPFPLVGHVDLTDGSSLHIFGIEAPNPLTRPRNRSADVLVERLNRLRDAYRQPGAGMQGT